MSEWQPIETATANAEGLFWIEPKTQAEFGITDTSGGDIVREPRGAGHPVLGKRGHWSCLMKATHWAPVTPPPKEG
jgi:hypothetical protein